MDPLTLLAGGGGGLDLSDNGPIATTLTQSFGGISGSPLRPRDGASTYLVAALAALAAVVVVLLARK